MHPSAPEVCGGHDVAARREFRYQGLLRLQEAVQLVRIALADPGAFRAWVAAREATWLAPRRACRRCPLAQYLDDAAGFNDHSGWYVSVDRGHAAIYVPASIQLEPTLVRLPRWARHFIARYDREGLPWQGTKAEVLAVLAELPEEGIGDPR